MTQPYYVTTPIYYVNDRPHIGHCYTTLLADVAARFARMVRGPDALRDVFFLTGTDEHAEKVVESARKNGVSPQEWADRNAAEYRRAFALMNFSHDDFVRTTEDRHKLRAAAYIRRLMDKGDIELGDYEGWYDASQEEYVTETTAKEHDYKSPVTGRPLERRTEQNYFFRLDRYEPWLRAEIESDRVRILPEARKNEILGRIRQGLNKVPVSRRIRPGDEDWGIRMPGDDAHRVYVWIEALCNYLSVVDNKAEIDTTTTEGDRRKFWPATLHLMAKDIVWFHAVIWPAMLHALGEEPPRCVYAHSYWIREGRKMSKSLGNFIDIDLIEAYSTMTLTSERDLAAKDGREARPMGIDPLRWYLATRGPLGETDADFSHAGFFEVYNAELANGIGNCVSRVGNMIEKYFGGVVPKVDWTLAVAYATSLLSSFLGSPLPGQTAAPTADVSLESDAAVELGRALWCLERVRLADASRCAIELVTDIDLFINQTRPFSVAKEQSMRATLASILISCAEALRIASLLLYPACPASMAQLWRDWNCDHLSDPADPNSPFVAPLEQLAQWAGPHGLKPGQRIRKGLPLFMRADAAEQPEG
ncbi:MAG: methionine--tRNA ligase [Phycisphaeraceae bacterium]|nr:methionine--tRNA ligase [Phycisphaeraceae bacterium]